MSETNGNLSLDPAGAIARLLDRVEHIDRVVSRLERLTDGGAIESLERLLSRAGDLDKLAALMEQVPGLVAMAADLFDEWAAAQVEEGIDVEKGLRQGLRAALWLGQHVSEEELQRLGILLRSDVLEPHALAVVGKTGRALATSHSAVCGADSPPMVGPVAALKALNDPDVQRSLAFVLRVAKSFGGHIAEADEIPASPNGRRSASHP